jgi:hypothetical protein
MRPLMVDTMRRNENDDHMSPTGLSPAFGHVGFAQGGSMGTPDVLSPLSLNSTDRYYPSHLSSPLSVGPRSSNPFDHQNSYQTLSHSRQHVRPLQPLQPRETMSRSRSESIQSPLRSSMSWKGETLDYGNYQTGQPSPQLSGRQQSVYQPDQIGPSTVNSHQYDENAYSSKFIPSFSIVSQPRRIARADSSHRCEHAKLADAHDIPTVAWSWRVVVATVVAISNVAAPSVTSSFPSRIGSSHAVPAASHAEQLSAWVVGNTKEQLIRECFYWWLRERTPNCTCRLLTAPDTH